jgi:hypothetical protein
LDSTDRHGYGVVSFKNKSKQKITAQGKMRKDNSVLEENDNYSKVKAALKEEYFYWRNNLTICNDLAEKLYGYQLLPAYLFTEIRALNNHRRHCDAFKKWFQYATRFYTEEGALMFCECLKEAGRVGMKPRLTRVGEYFKNVLKGTY